MNPTEPDGEPDFWEQWKTILWLRWRLSRNQWRRRGLLDRLSQTVLIVLGLITVLISSLGGFLAGFLGLAHSSPSTILYVIDGFVVLFLFFWIAGLLTEIQRSESLDIAKLMHLPVSLGRIFIFNYLSSWLTLSVLVTLPALLFLAIGLAFSRGALVLGLIPAAVGFFFLTTAVTYLLRGWLASLMSNERRRRAVLVFTSVLAVAFFQLPNFYFNVLRERPGKTTTPPPTWLASASVAAPPLWVGAAAQALVQGHPGPAAGATAGSVGLGLLALLVSYRGSLRALRGGSHARTVKAIRRPNKVSTMISWDLPLVSPEVSAIVFGTLRSHLRAPEVKVALFGQAVMAAVFAFILFRPLAGVATRFPSSASGPLLAMLALIGSSQILFNQFGFDRDGFRSTVLAPVARKDLLFGKTLAAFPLVAGVGFLILLLGGIFRILSAPAFASAALVLAAGFFLFATLGNWLSIIAPYKVVAGSLKKTKTPPKVGLFLSLGLLLSPTVGAVMFFPTLAEILLRPLFPGFAPYLNVMASMALLGTAAGLYFLLLPPLGRLLERREKEILAAVTREIE